MGEIVDGVWCNPDGGSRLTSPHFSVDVGVRFESHYNTVWVRHTHDEKGRSMWEGWLEGDDEPHELDHDTVKRMMEAHSPEETATDHIKNSPFSDN